MPCSSNGFGQVYMLLLRVENITRRWSCRHGWLQQPPWNAGQAKKRHLCERERERFCQQEKKKKKKEKDLRGFETPSEVKRRISEAEFWLVLDNSTITGRTQTEAKIGFSRLRKGGRRRMGEQRKAYRLTTTPAWRSKHLSEATLLQ